MKKVKFILPAIALVFAIIGAFASANSNALVGAPDFYINGSNVCTQISNLSCDNQAQAPLCKFRVGASSFQVYDTKTTAGACQTTLTHSTEFLN